ncbi:MAG: citrate synthase [Oscillospiraceae bacterium]|jgi:citrate synthase|nr:citrate synthase [Oscillospiraceae bacterium]
MQHALSELCTQMTDAYSIPAEQFEHESVKRGLRNTDGTGVIAGVTRIGSVRGYHMEDGVPVPAEGRLYYRGIDVMDIVRAHNSAGTFGFEEVSYLLLLGRLPDDSQYTLFKSILESARKLPDGFFEDMILKAPSANVMNKLSRSVLALYSSDPCPDDMSSENLVRQSIELIARLPVIVADAYAVKRHYYDKQSLLIHTPAEGSVAENFLHMLRSDNCYTREEALLLDLMLILHAEHGGGNNSAFACRVLASTGTDTYGCIAGAINSLKGPLHGGANQKVMEMFRDIHAHVTDPTDEEEIYRYLCKVRDREAGDRTGKIYGLGHAVYTISDPRAVLLKQCVAALARKTAQTNAFQLMERIERQGTRALYAKLGTKKRLCANVDMYSGLVYQMLGIPEELFTPLFAIARIAGWCAHRIEEALTGNRIIRPAYRAMMERTEYVAMDAR